MPPVCFIKGEGSPDIRFACRQLWPREKYPRWRYNAHSGTFSSGAGGREVGKSNIWRAFEFLDIKTPRPEIRTGRQLMNL